MYRIEFSKNAIKFFSKYKWQKIILQIEKDLNLLMINPFYKWLDIKKMKWKTNIYRLRIWDFRLIYEVINDKLIIFCINIWVRWDIYK